MISEAQGLLNLECPKGKVDRVIDSDTYNEIDDQFVISYAIHAPEKIRVQAIYRCTRDPSLRPCKMVYNVNRDALLSDLFEHIRGN